MENSISEDHLDHLVCPICHEVPRGNILQCKNGHHICDQCISSQVLENCPHCRIDYDQPKIRNRALETLLDSMKFDCVNKESGCLEKLARGQLSTHENTCNFQSLKLCKLIGYENCEFVASNDPQLNIAHLQQCHEIAIGQGPELNIKYEYFSSFNANIPKDANGQDKICWDWEPLLWRLEKDNFQGPTFLFVLRISRGSETVGEHKRAISSWICIFMGDSEIDADKFVVEYSFPNVFAKRHERVTGFELRWKGGPTPLKDVRKLLGSLEETLISSVPLSFIMYYQYTSDADKLNVDDNDDEQDFLLVQAKISTTDAIRGIELEPIEVDTIHLLPNYQ